MKLTILCLCAEWCETCRTFRAAFEQVRAARTADRCRWVDIEEQDALLVALDIDIESLPTLIVVDDQHGVRFAGPISPFAEIALRLCRTADEGGLWADPRHALASRAAAFASALADA